MDIEFSDGGAYIMPEITVIEFQGGVLCESGDIGIGSDQGYTHEPW